MISEKELRIGNLYATARNQEILVTGIDTINKFVSMVHTSDEVNAKAKNDNTLILEDLHAIEITMGKIYQWGFRKEEDLSMAINSDNNARFTWNENLQQVVLQDGNSGIIGQEIKYIHQLQNIYYYLTGKELPLSY